MNQEWLETLFVDLLDSLPMYIGYAIGTQKFTYLESKYEGVLNLELDIIKIGILNLMDALKDKFEEPFDEEEILERRKLFKLIMKYCYFNEMGQIDLNPLPKSYDSDPLELFDFDGFLSEVEKQVQEMEEREVILEGLEFLDKLFIAFEIEDSVGGAINEVIKFRIYIAKKHAERGQWGLVKEIIEKILVNTKGIYDDGDYHLETRIYEEAKKLIDGGSEELGSKVREWISRLIGNSYRCTAHLGQCMYTYELAKGDPSHGIEPYTLFEDLPRDWRCPNCGGSKDKFQNLELFVSWDCPDCGYGYNADRGETDLGIKPGTLFRDLPEDWICPNCGGAKNRFRVVS